MRKWLIVSLSVTLLLGACSVQQESVQTQNSNYVEQSLKTADANEETNDVSQFEQFPLVSVIDGDTIKIKYNGSDESVRLLLIDTPETKHPTLGKQPYGQEAKEFTKQLLAGQQTVYIEFDVSYRDKYKRLLAYVYTTDGKSVQQQLLKNGLARVAYIYAPNTKHVDWFEQVQKEAKQREVGIWSIDNYVTDRGFDKEVVNEEMNEAPIDDKCTFKGNINTKGEKIYHLPGQQHYEVTKPEVMFCSAEEAERAGFRASLR